jgi:hypothetical protein
MGDIVKMAIVFFMTAILTGVRWNFQVVLICISFMARNVGFFMGIALNM